MSSVLHARDISNATQSSTKTFTTALWLNAAVFALELLAFTLLRPRFRAVYEPRAYLLPAAKRTPALGTNLITWPFKLWTADPRRIREANGLDAYFFVRFLRMVLKILVPIWIVSWAVLLPITSVKTGQGKTGLDRFTFGNVGAADQSRHWAHLALAWLFTFWTLYVLRSEFLHFISTRHLHLSSPAYSATPRARTLLLTGVPAPLLNPVALKALYRDIPGGVHQVWINRDLGDMPKQLKRRDKAFKALESAENKLLKTAAKAHTKRLKNDTKTRKKDQKSGSLSYDPDLEPGRADPSVPAADLATLVPSRPSKRLPPGPLPFGLPLMGEKVDSIEWARTEAAEAQANLDKGKAALRAQIEREARTGATARTGGVAAAVGKVVSKVGSKVGATHGAKDEGVYGVDPRAAAAEDADAGMDGVGSTAGGTDVDGSIEDVDGGTSSNKATFAPLNSAFVLFASARAAHMAAQLRAHHAPARVQAGPAAVDVAPEDVIWGNLGLNPYECQIRRFISWGITFALIIFWAIPVAFVGVVSNVAGLCATYGWLAWLCKIPGTVLGIIQGILPPVLLAVLMMLLPIILRLLARFEGMTRRTQVELSLMSRYFLFQVIHSFLIVTLASGIISALPQLVNNPTGIPSILANRLPQASTFFLTYVVLQGLSGAASSFLQAVPLVLYYAKLNILGSTPRSIYTMKHAFRSVSWGTLFPATTLIVVITLSYSIISPIINGLAVVTFALFYFVYKYLFLYTLAQRRALDTGGLFFPRALQHVFVGLYLQQVCLAALFFLAQDAGGRQSAIPEGALMVVLIIITAILQYILNTMYRPLVDFLPLSLARRAEDRALAGAQPEHGMGVGDYGDALVGAGAGAGMGAGAGTGPRQSTEKGRPSYDEDREYAAGSEDADGSSIPPGTGRVPPSPGHRHHRHHRHHDEHPRHKDQLFPEPQPQPYSQHPPQPPQQQQQQVQQLPEQQPAKHDFTHPALHATPGIVWLADDALGFAPREVEACRAAGVDAIADGKRLAYMDARGKVVVREEAVPPGQEDEVEY